MNTLLWSATLAIAGAWLYALPFFQRGRLGPAVVLTVLGFAAIAVVLRRNAHRWSTILACLGGVASVQVLLAPPVALLASRVHALEVVAIPITSLLRLVGLDAWREGATIHLQTSSSLVPVLVSVESLGLLPLFSILGSALLLATVGRKWSLRWILKLTTLISLFVVLRMAFLIVMVSNFSDPQNLRNLPMDQTAMALLIRSHWQLVSMIPLVLVLGRLAPLDVSPRPLTPVLEGRTLTWVRVGAVIVASTLMAHSLLVHPSGERKDGRVVLDELHSREWASAARALDTEWFGRESVYNFATVVDLVGERYDLTVNDAEEYSEDFLSDVDVLVIKPPSSPFDNEEILAIERWVESGGGLFLIGDHTDLLGMMSNLNQLAHRFDIDFKLDACNRLEDGLFVEYVPPPLLTHPIMRGVEQLKFMTSCTLGVPFHAENVILSGNAFSDPADYQSFSFFGNVRPDLSDAFGVHVLAAGVRHGQGRVLAFSDSTLFSSFAITYADRPEFLLQSIEYLNHVNPVGGSGGFWLGVSALLAALFVRRQPSRFAPPVTAGLLLAGGVLGAYSSTVSSAISVPAPRTPAPRIAFVFEKGEAGLAPALVELRRPRYQTFDTFYVWNQRLGFVPRESTLEEAIGADVLVLINPSLVFTRSEVSEVRRWVGNGGRLLIMDSVLNPKSTANDVLQPFGMSLTFNVEETGTDESAMMTPVVQFLGGEPVAFEAPAAVSVRSQVYGKGRVYCVADSVTFSRVGMGQQTDDENSEEIAANHQLQFELMRKVVRDRPRPQTASAGVPQG